MSTLASQSRAIEPNHAPGEYPTPSADAGEAWERKADGLAVAAAQAAIANGHRAVTMDIPDGTVVTSHVGAIFQELPPKEVVIHHANGDLGLYRRAYVACGIESTRALNPARLAMFTIDPADKPVNVIAKRRGHEDDAGDRQAFDTRPACHDGGET